MKIKWMNLFLALIIIMLYTSLTSLGETAKQIHELIGMFCFGWLLGDVLQPFEIK